ncbi:Os12g0637700 [Oryza sativa Japonica Group]|uniref:Nodulin family protein, putative, expressed n=2 Tax=Oryza sativa subsp. japonica TaxID=39947 RepID=Q2QLL5_ORYSJ|nr:nodulin family protein, putative, expressed [Oryza sativa Japonica Group]BAF30392.1 Os12g0637700 [Oryza sativa Japonica Group]BAT18266.1 Os12g0637700 [Oryza sativa Japonica Group]|eukprot:NP_001067373.1 Os12g0637700 [Oryza sativa Japonica Group]
MAGAAAAAFAAQVLRGRWFMAYGSFLIMSAAGATYIFAIYSKDIKSTLGYTQEQLNTVGFFKDVGANIGIHAGLIAEVTPPWFVLAIGAAMNLGGYLMLYLSVTGRVGARTPLWLVCLYIAVGANSQAFANTGALVTCVKNFPESRGVMLGLLKGFVGLSGAIFTQLYLSFYGGGGSNTKPLILLVGWLPAAISVAFLGTIRIIRAPRSPTAARREYRAFCGFLYVSLALAAYLLVVIVLQKRFKFTRAEYAVSAAVVFAALLAPFAIVLREEAALFRKTPPKEEADDVPALSAATKPSPAAAETPPATAMERVVRALRPPPRGEDYTILQALVSVDMVLLFTATVFGVGGTLTAIDNMGQIGESLGYPQRSIATLVSLISIWNYLGRVSAGFASDALLSRYGISRPVVVTGVLLLTVAGHLLVAFGVPGSLYAASVLIGFCFGAAYPMILAIISEVFGLKYYSTLYNVGNVACPVGSYILNVRVAGRMYDREARRQGARGRGGGEEGADVHWGEVLQGFLLDRRRGDGGRGGGDGGARVADQEVLRRGHLRALQGGGGCRWRWRWQWHRRRRR